MNELSCILWVLVLISFFVLAIQRKQSSLGTCKPQEPLYIPELFPFVSHTRGVFNHGAIYYRKIWDKTHFPVFSIRMLTARIYVVCDTSIISEIQKQATISFDPFIVLAAERLAEVSEACMKLIQNDLKTQRSSSIIGDTHSRVHKMLKAGPCLDQMVGVMLQTASEALKDITEVDLFDWTRRTVCIASTNAVYGPENPFRADPTLEPAFWDYEAGISLLLLNFMPTITARKAHKARHTLKRAFANYFHNGGSTHASELIRMSYKDNTKHGVSHEDQGAFELTTCIGLLVNTAPTLFWTLMYIFSDAHLLSALRNELNAILETQFTKDFVEKKLDVRRLKNECPLLNSTFKEVLRLHASSLSSRFVTEDTTVKGEIFLKKGSVVHIPSAILHRNLDHWGPEVNSFNSSRFLKQENFRAPRQKQSLAFRPFGGGTTLCPGRHFATTEILSIVAMILLQFEVIPEEGKWRFPSSQEGSIATTVLPPSSDIRVRFIRRAELQTHRYIFTPGSTL